MLSVEGLDDAADGTGLPPISVSELAARVLPLVLKSGECFQVFDSVVELVPVLVVNLHAGRNGAVD